MAGPPRPTPPSAFDGYRRLERTRRVVTERPVAAATATMPRSRPSRARLAGAMRLAAFVAVLAIIVGTSVGLASADTSPAEESSGWGEARTQPRAESSDAAADVQLLALRAKPAEVSTPVGVTATATGNADSGEAAGPSDVAATTADDAVASGVADAAAAETAVAGAVAAPAGGEPTSSAQLPFTGTPSVDRLLLAGASLVLLGMLVQITGQPLPARARARR